MRFSANDADAAHDLLSEYTYATPRSLLIRKVLVRGPFGILHGGMRLVDLPGDGDINTYWSDIGKEYIRDCSHIWVVMEANRLNALRENKTLIQRIVLDGMLDRCCFIITKGDQVKPGKRGVSVGM